MYQTNKFTAYAGRSHEIAVTMIDENGIQIPTDGMTTIALRVPHEDGTFFNKENSAGFAWGVIDKTYIYTFLFTEAETALLKLGENQDVFVRMGFGTKAKKYRLKKFLTVLPELFND